MSVSQSSEEGSEMRAKLKDKLKPTTLVSCVLFLFKELICTMFQAKQQRKENKLFTSSFMQSCDDALRTVHMCTHTQLA